MKRLIYILILVALPGLMLAQSIKAYRSVSELNNPDLLWYTVAKDAPGSFEVMRSTVGANTFGVVRTFRKASVKGDTVYYQVIDTTLTAKGLYEYYIETTDAKGVRTASEIMYGHNMGSVPSPSIISFTATPAAGKKALVLNWNLNYSFTVKALVLFRSRHHSKGFVPIATLPADARTYTDAVDISNEAWYYFIQIRDYFGYQIPSVVIHGIATYREKGYPPQNFTASAGNRTVNLTWRKLGGNLVGFDIYRQAGNDPSFFRIGDRVPAIKDTITFSDTAVVREGMTVARYYAVSVSDGYLESEPTDTIEVTLPWNIRVTPPGEADALPDSSGLRLYWSMEGLTPDIMGFNIYRSYDGKAPVKVNPSLVPYPLNTYLDLDVKPSGPVYYEIESVSIAGTPSEVRTKAFADRALPDFHVVLVAEVTGADVAITWIKPSFPGLETFYFYRKEGSASARMAGMVNPASQSWTDSGLTPGTTYIYTLVAEFKDGTRILVNEGVLVTLP